MAIDWSTLRQTIDTHDRFLITSHVRPDGDAIGSELAMSLLLSQRGKTSIIANTSRLPPRYRFLDPSHRVRHFATEVSAEELRAIDVIIVLDTSSWVQLDGVGDYIRASGAHRVVIDHHVSHDDLGADVFRDTTAAACGVLVAEAAEHLGCTLTADVAEPLFVAIATDTGWFRFGSTDGRTLRIAARLIEAGVTADRLYRLIYEENSLGRLKLIGRMLDKVEVILGGRVAYSSVQLSDLKETGAIAQDSEDLVNYTLSVAGVAVGLLFTELGSGGVKVSFRSRAAFDCTRLAARFGGGGHRQAAGATIVAPIGDAVARVLDALAAELDGLT